MPTAIESTLRLTAETAADLMSAPVPSIPHRASFQEAVAFFIDHNLTVAPVVGDRGEPVGVLSMADVLIHVRASAPADKIAPATAARLMTPTVFSVTPKTPAVDVIQDMLRSKVHHLFVIDPDGRIMGVVSACDVLQHLQ
jgi:CBS-domain-containing membrane protein